MLRSTDWNFLIGGQAVGVTISLDHAQLSPFRDMSIEIHADFNHERGSEILSDATDLPTRATTLVSLTLFVSAEKAKSFVVTTSDPSRTIVVG